MKNYKTDSSHCYNDRDSYCATHGRLYGASAAMTACPKGWHLPDTAEWDILMAAVGGARVGYGSNRYEFAGKFLKSKSGWAWGEHVLYGYLYTRIAMPGNGKDKFGFAALPGGVRNASGSFDHIDRLGTWWVAADGGAEHIRNRNMHTDIDDVFEGEGDHSGFGYSVRCLRD